MVGRTRPAVGCGFSGDGGRGTFKAPVVLGLAGEWEESSFPSSLVTVFYRFVQTDKLSSQYPSELWAV